MSTLTNKSTNKSENTENDFDKIEKRALISKRIRLTITYIFLSIWAIVVLFPFYWMILTSIKSYSSYNSEHMPKFYASDPTLKNYADALKLYEEE